MPFIHLLLFLKAFIYLGVLILSCHMRDLQLQYVGFINSSLMREATCAPCVGSVESLVNGLLGKS